MANRPLWWGIAAARRRLCTAAAAATDDAAAALGAAVEWKPLYRRLSAPGGSVAEKMCGWLREGRVATAGELMRYVRELRRYKSYRHALELMEWMEKKDMHMTDGMHAVRLDLISKTKGMDLVESYFFNLPESSKNRQTYGALLNSYCNEKLEDKAIALYEKMKELNMISGTLVHNCLMTLYMKLGHPEKVSKHFQDMKSINTTPDSYSYCILMNCYASQNDIDSVERVIQEMKKGSEVDLHWSIYSNLASHYNSAGLFEKTEFTLKKLEKVMNRRDRVAYHHLISLYAGAGNLAEVNRVWKLLKTAFVKTTNMSYLVMLHALQKLDDIDALRQCFEEWESVYISYDMRLVNTVIAAYLRKDMVHEAASLRDEAMKKSAEFDFRTLELFLDYYLGNHSMNLAVRCLENAASCAKQEWKPRRDNVHRILMHFEEAKDVDGAEEVCKHLKKLKCLDIEAYESLLRTYLAAGEKEPLLNQRIKEDGLEIRPETEKLLEMVCVTD